MNSILFASMLAVAASFYLPAYAQTANSAKALTVAEIYKDGSPPGKPPQDLVWSPDGARFTFISDDGNLMQVEAETGKTSVLVGHAKLSGLISANTPEKDKDHRARYNMTGYIWAPDSRHLLFDSNGQLWLYDLHNGTGLQVAFTGAASGDDPKFSPDGSALSFIRDHNLYVCQLRKPGTPTMALSGARDPSILNGQVDWMYLEELGTRSNYFWSPDSRQIAYLQMNETGVSEYPLVDWIPTHAQVDVQLYPQPGGNNPSLRIAVANATGGKTIWMKLPAQENDSYIPRFGWASRKTLWIETLSRDQKHRRLYFADATNGNTSLALTLDDEKFFDEAYDVLFSSSHLVLTSWQDGHSHIYLYSFDPGNPTVAKPEGQLTKGDFEVSSLLDIEESTHCVFFLSNEGDPREQHLWLVRLDGTGKRRITESAGWHEPVPYFNTGFFADTHSTRMQPPVVSLCRIGIGCKPVWEPKPLTSLAITKPEALEFKTADGTLLYGELLLPKKTATATVPLILNPYGGPHAQSVRNAWSGNILFDELLVQHGYAVLHVDNRGMGGRGRAFAQAAYMDFGKVQREDQMLALDDVLARYPQLDANRLGWWGWSWGGTFTLNAMTNSSRFVAGVAVGAVTDWRNYDSAYTERYLGTPAANPDGYRNFSVLSDAEKLKGHVLLVQGTGDDNVHIANTMQFIQRLVAADIPYDLQLYPRKTHSISGEEARTHLFERILAHFDTYLMNAQHNVAGTVTNTENTQ